MERAFRFEELTSISSWKWSQFYQPSKFYWIEGVTPFSSLQILPIAMSSYLLVIGLLYLWMKNRKAFSLTGIAAFHNLLLSIWSFIMLVGTIYELVQLYLSGGVMKIYCDSSSAASGAIYYWIYIYYFSKFVEFFDTVIIILRKKPLIFLHVYHHCVVVLVIWLWLDQRFIFASLGLVFNTFVHVIMYYFYYVSILGKRVWWKKYVTSIQIVQFASSFLLCLPYLYYRAQVGDAKCVGWNAFLFSAFCNLSFLILFIQFYFRTYSGTSSSKKEE